VSVLAQPESFSRFQARKRTSLPVLTNPIVMRPAVMSKSVIVSVHKLACAFLEFQPNLLFDQGSGNKKNHP